MEPEPRPRAAGPRVQAGRHPARVCRDRLQSLGPEALSDGDLLTLVLGCGGRGGSTARLAEDLLARAGDLGALARLAEAELAQLPGLGPARVSCLVAALEIGRRVATRRLRRGDAIRGPADVHQHFFQRLRQLQREHFVALLLDGRHRVVRECGVSQGTLTASLVHPREVFRTAVREAAAAIVLAHNHPSGDPSPSEEDREVTRRLARAGEILGIRVLDHVVIAEHGFYSFREAGELDASGLQQSGPASDPPRAPGDQSGASRDSRTHWRTPLMPQGAPVDEGPEAPRPRARCGELPRPGNGDQGMSKVSVEFREGPDPSDSQPDRRRSQRTNLIVRVDYSTVDELFSEFTRDINEGGLFIETEKPRPTGTEVAMHFNLPGSREVVRTVGRVVRVCSGDTDSPPGMGIEFDELTHEDRQKINALIRALRIGSVRD